MAEADLSSSTNTFRQAKEVYAQGDPELGFTLAEFGELQRRNDIALQAAKASASGNADKMQSKVGKQLSDLEKAIKQGDKEKVKELSSTIRLEQTQLQAKARKEQMENVDNVVTQTLGTGEISKLVGRGAQEYQMIAESVYKKLDAGIPQTQIRDELRSYFEFDSQNLPSFLGGDDEFKPTSKFRQEIDSGAAALVRDVQTGQLVLAKRGPDGKPYIIANLPATYGDDYKLRVIEPPTQGQ